MGAELCDMEISFAQQLLKITISKDKWVGMHMISRKESQPYRSIGSKQDSDHLL